MLNILQVILLTAMEYMREETDEKETETQTGRQKRSKKNWASRIKTFGKKSSK